MSLLCVVGWLCCVLWHAALEGANAGALSGGAVRVAPSVAWTHAQSRPCTDNTACGIVVVAWRLLLWDTGTHQIVSEAGEGIRAFEGGFVFLGGGSCAAVLACGDGERSG